VSGAGTDTRTAKSDSKEVRELVARTLAAGKRIALFLDYDGTLREIEREPDAAKPTAEIKELLHRLSQHPNLDVTILSGRSQENLEAFLGAYPFRLIAEHGATWRPPGQKDWERLDKNLNYAGKRR
jgi:trehalose 6-phosphate synthase/phosphatase